MFEAWKSETSAAVQDFYASVMLGEDAGLGERLVVILQPPPTTFFLTRTNFPKRLWNSLGLKFVSIQNRAYVQQVEEGSPADLQGVLPRDCIQYAAVLAKEWAAPLTEDYDDISKQALERESSGQRISFTDLKRILERGMETYSTEQAASSSSFLSPPTVPTTISLDKHSASNKSGKVGQDLITPQPLVLVLRRTKQRPPPSSSLGNLWPRFRLDDECLVAVEALESLVLSNSSEHDTIKSYIKECQGIAFLKNNKFTLGLSVSGGSGIVMARGQDGSWSPPSAIGTYGIGVGLQLGVEVAHTLILLQTKEALEHFLRGASFQIGVGGGGALASVGRSAFWNENFSGSLCGSTQILETFGEDEYNASAPPLNTSHQVSSSSKEMRETEESTGTPKFANNQMINGMTPIMAYAMSGGLYVGVSLEGTKLFTRHEINARTYQFFGSKHDKITVQDILQSKLSMPHEALPVIALLGMVEYQYDFVKTQQLIAQSLSITWKETTNWKSTQESIDTSGYKEFLQAFQNLLFGGVSVTQIHSSSPKPKKDKSRTLWLYRPLSNPSSSLELGFVSKLSERRNSLAPNTVKHSSHPHNTDAISTTSEDLTLDSALLVSIILS